MDKRMLLGLGLTLVLVLILPIYFFGEPARMEAASLAFKAEAAERGAKLYADFCAECHGARGEGEIGPALNEKRFLSKAHDDVLFDIIRDGVPNTAMPSWGQARGGPLTDQQVFDLVTFMRGWEATAPLGKIAEATPDPKRGADIYFATCVACHGKDGKGTARVPVALNDQEKLALHDDAWFFQVISQGRLNRGMPTWGKVLAPKQINDIIAHLRTWQTSAALIPTAPPAPTGSSTSTAAAPTALAGFSTVATLTPTLIAAAPATIAPYPTLAPASATPTATPRPVKLAQFYPATKPSVAEGKVIYGKRCEACHGEKGDGKGPVSASFEPRPTNFGDSTNLRPESAEKLFNAVTNGVPNTDMPEFQKQLSEEARWNVLAYVLMTFVNPPGKVAAGRALYEQNCRACHGDAGRGDGPDAPGLTIKPTDLSNAQRFAALSSQDLFEFISNEGDPPLRDLRLHSFGKKLSEDERWNVIHFLWTFVFGG